MALYSDSADFRKSFISVKRGYLNFHPLIMSSFGKQYGHGDFRSITWIQEQAFHTSSGANADQSFERWHASENLSQTTRALSRKKTVHLWCPE